MWCVMVFMMFFESVSYLSRVFSKRRPDHPAHSATEVGAIRLEGLSYAKKKHNKNMCMLSIVILYCYQLLSIVIICYQMLWYYSISDHLRTTKFKETYYKKLWTHQIWIHPTKWSLDLGYLFFPSQNNSSCDFRHQRASSPLTKSDGRCEAAARLKEFIKHANIKQQQQTNQQTKKQQPTTNQHELNNPTRIE